MAAVIPFCAVVAAASTHSVVEDIEDYSALPNATVYDCLRLPSYKPHAAHVASHAAIVAELTAPRSGCTCGPRRAAALGLVTAAFVFIATPALKAAYDANAAIGGFAGLCPAAILPVSVNPPVRAPRFATTPTLPYHRWSPEIKNLKGTSFSFFEGGLAPIRAVFCRKMANTFWNSLSTALRDTPEFWAEMKAATNGYYNNVVTGAVHPRRFLYNDLNAAGILRGVPPLQTQLNPDVAGVVPSPIIDVTTEPWQVVADAWAIELIVFFDAVRVGRRKMYIARGSHNARQFFMLLEADGEYHGIAPVVMDTWNWRFTEHMPAKVHPTQQQFADSAEDRSPYYQIGANGYFLTPTAPIIRQTTGLPHVVQEVGGDGDVILLVL